MEDEIYYFNSMDEVINSKRYQTGSSDLLAFGKRFDGKYTTYKGLFRTRNGNYFFQTDYDTGNRYHLYTKPSKMKALSRNKALEEYWHLTNKIVPVEESFPGVEIEDA